MPNGLEQPDWIGDPQETLLAALAVLGDPRKGLMNDPIHSFGDLDGFLPVGDESVHSTRACMPGLSQIQPRVSR